MNTLYYPKPFSCYWFYKPELFKFLKYVIVYRMNDYLRWSYELQLLQESLNLNICISYRWGVIGENWRMKWDYDNVLSDQSITVYFLVGLFATHFRTPSHHWSFLQRLSELQSHTSEGTDERKTKTANWQAQGKLFPEAVHSGHLHDCSGYRTKPQI
jgi:hypothetical protein